MHQLNSSQVLGYYKALKITLFQIRKFKKVLDNRGVEGILILINLNYETLQIC
jgi:hypothetical protein